ncbi:MAG TPA: hypothetical protein VGK79_11920 [Gaiellaceae bacterium]
MSRIPVDHPVAVALPYAAAAATAAALPLGVPLRIGLPLVFVAAAAKRAVRAARRRAHLRRVADDWLATAAAPSPNAFAWRVDELLGRERKAVAGALRSYARLRADDLLAAVADVLDDRAVSPRAVVRARDLITNPGSSLHCSARRDELRGDLEAILRPPRRGS